MGPDLARVPGRALYRALYRALIWALYNAKCFTAHDTERLHKVFEATEHAKITKLVADLFVAKLEERENGPYTALPSLKKWARVPPP